MDDTMSPDWSRLAGSDPAGDYARAFQMGRQLAAQSPHPLANSVGAPDPSMAAPPMGGVDSHIAGMGDDQRMAAVRRAEALAAMLRGLQSSTPDPGQRLQIARHLAAATPGLGVDPRSIAIGDVTDQGIASHIAAVIGLQRQLGTPDPHAGMSPDPRTAAAMFTGAGGQPRQTDTQNQGGVRYIGPVD